MLFRSKSDAGNGNAVDSYDDSTRYLVQNSALVVPSDWSQEMITSYQGSLGEAKAPGALDDALSISIGQALPFRLVPVGATFIRDGKILMRQDSETRAWDWFHGGFSPIGENEVVKPVSPMFSPFDRLPFPEETSVLKGKLWRR